jgi:hypothetical protein
MSTLGKAVLNYFLNPTSYQPPENNRKKRLFSGGYFDWFCIYFANILKNETAVPYFQAWTLGTSAGAEW